VIAYLLSMSYECFSMCLYVVATKLRLIPPDVLDGHVDALCNQALAMVIALIAYLQRNRQPAQPATSEDTVAEAA